MYCFVNFCSSVTEEVYVTSFRLESVMATVTHIRLFVVHPTSHSLGSDQMSLPQGELFYPKERQALLSGVYHPQPSFQAHCQATGFTLKLPTLRQDMKWDRDSCCLCGPVPVQKGLPLHPNSVNYFQDESSIST